jgi:hypothetical protein
MGFSPAVVAFDQNGNPIGVIQDDAIYRLQVEADIAPGAKVEVVFPSVPSNPSNLLHQHLVNPLDDSPNMLVDGSGTAVEFRLSADPTVDFVLSELRTVMSADNIDFKGSNFGPLNMALANGLLVEISIGGTVTELDNLKINEDFLAFHSPAGVFYQNTGPFDSFAAGLSFGGAVVLAAGSSDYLRMVVRDDLTNNKFKYFQATVWGSRAA